MTGYQSTKSSASYSTMPSPSFGGIASSSPPRHGYARNARQPVSTVPQRVNVHTPPHPIYPQQSPMQSGLRTYPHLTHPQQMHMHSPSHFNLHAEHMQQMHMQDYAEDIAVAREMIRERKQEDPAFASKVDFNPHYAAQKLSEYTLEAKRARLVCLSCQHIH